MNLLSKSMLEPLATTSPFTSKVPILSSDVSISTLRYKSLPSKSGLKLKVALVIQPAEYSEFIW